MNGRWGVGGVKKNREFPGNLFPGDWLCSVKGPSVMEINGGEPGHIGQGIRASGGGNYP